MTEAKTNMNILLLEDEAIIAMDICTVLERSGYRVVHCTTCRDALEKVKSFKPTLLLLDIMLKDSVDGVVAGRKLRDKLGELPIVFITAHSDMQIFDKIKHMKHMSFLMKPYHEANLLMAIKLALFKSTSDTSAGDINRSITHKGKDIQITPRELEVIQHVAMGLTSDQIADKLFLSVHTVNTHRKNIRGKIGIHNPVELIQTALKSGLL